MMAMRRHICPEDSKRTPRVPRSERKSGACASTNKSYRKHEKRLQPSRGRPEIDTHILQQVLIYNESQ